MNIFETSLNVEMIDNFCIFSCIYKCEKNIYDTPRIEQTLKTEMINNYFDHSISFDNAFSVREIQLENLLNYQKSDLHSLMKNISNKESKDIIEKIKQYELSENVLYFSKKYKKYFDERNVFLWKFLGSIFTEAGATLSTVDKKYFDSVTDIKIIVSILCGILDDIADVHKNKELLNVMINILYKKENCKYDTSELKDEKISFIKEIWNFLSKELKKLPRYYEFKDIFMYDFKQFLNTFEYSCLINKNPDMICLRESENYDAHNMMVFIFNGIDLMASPKFDKDELPYLRTAFWHAQRMARIGNWLSTWKRELKQNDLSSGVFSYAVSKKILDKNELINLPKEEIISRIERSDTYEFFIDAWQQNHKELYTLRGKINSVDMESYINGLENVIKYHLSTEGLK